LNLEVGQFCSILLSSTPDISLIKRCGLSVGVPLY